MKNKFVKIICVIVIISVVIVAIGSLGIPVHYLLSSETIGRYEYSAMKESMLLNEQSTIMIINGAEVDFPLPNGAVEFENNAYPVYEGGKQFLVTTKSFSNYIDALIQQYGYVSFQEGAMFIITNADNSIQVDISTGLFTRDFMRIQLFPGTISLPRDFLTN